FCLRLSKDCGVAPGSHVLLALSGGADSAALFCLLLEARQRMPLTLSCAHVEHGIRGEASLADCAFVSALCEEKHVPLYTAHVDAPAYAKAHGCGLEDAARTLRYEFLNRTAEEIGADAIALAHHAGDQAETVLLHAMRGSDVRGLCAMRARSGRLIRPLLSCRPEELRAYLAAIGQAFCEDATNADRAYARNRVRLDVLPQMEQAVPGAGGALCRLAAAAQRDEDYFDQQIDALNLRVLPLVDGAAVKKDALLAMHPALCSRVLVRLIARAGLAPQRGETIGQIMDALDREDAAVNLTGDAHAVIGMRHLCVVCADRPCPDVPLRVPGVTDTPFGRFEVRPALPGEWGNGKTAQSMPARLLADARVGSRREGETMAPFGRSAPVKLKKLMIDAGVERAMRRSVPVVRNGETVLFAVGLRPGECCRGNEDEERMLVRYLGDWPCAKADRDE
ncbi:MAG: tRNA lysidine(34) synthetase TilS, partial [Candidatus Ventricola sp.]